MGNVSFWVVEGVVCVPLGGLVWASQRVLNSLHPSQQHVYFGPLLLRATALLLLLIMTCLMTTCLFVVAALSAPDWQTRFSQDTLWLALVAGSGLALALVLVCATLARIGRIRRAPGSHRERVRSEQEKRR